MSRATGLGEELFDSRMGIQDQGAPNPGWRFKVRTRGQARCSILSEVLGSIDIFRQAITSADPEGLKKKLNAEIANGRLAPGLHHAFGACAELHAEHRRRRSRRISTCSTLEFLSFTVTDKNASSSGIVT